MNVKINDMVLVIVGKSQAEGGDKGKQGKVIATSPKNGTVTVEGVNLRKKAKKARRANEVSQIVEKECPIDVSNVMVVCPSCGKPVRVHHAVVDGKKVRVCGGVKGCGAVLDKAYAGKGGKAEKTEAPKKRTRKRAAKAEKAEDKAE